MKRNTHAQHPIIQYCLILALWFTAQTASAIAIITMDMIVTPVAGHFQYDISIENSGSVDVVIVSIIDAPIGDPLIDPSLTTPAGFLGSYDDMLGFIDFLENTDSFFAGTTKSGFSFESEVGPGLYFTMFEALTVNGDLLRGSINVVNAVPETGGTLLMAGLGFMALALARRKFST